MQCDIFDLLQMKKVRGRKCVTKENIEGDDKHLFLLHMEVQ